MPLIATLTLNPAMDLSVSTARVISTEKLRCSLPRHDPGGGGINVARVVKTLGGRAIAIYPAGGPFGDLLQRSLDELGLVHRPVSITGDTRESFTVDELGSGLQYRFVLPGPTLSAQELQRCLDSLAALQPTPDYVVLSGSFPPGVGLGFYDELLALTRGIGCWTYWVWFIVRCSLLAIPSRVSLSVSWAQAVSIGSCCPVRRYPRRNFSVASTASQRCSQRRPMWC